MWVSYQALDRKAVFRRLACSLDYQILAHGVGRMNGNSYLARLLLTWMVTAQWSLLLPAGWRCSTSTKAHSLWCNTIKLDVNPFMNVFESVRHFHDCLDARGFILGMRVHGTQLYVRDGSVVPLAAADGWTGCWLHWDGREVVNCRFRGNLTHTPFACMKEESNYEYQLGATFGCFWHRFRFVDLLQGSMRPTTRLRYFDHS